jgi:hypothetical protein
MDWKALELEMAAMEEARPGISRWLSRGWMAA